MRPKTTYAKKIPVSQIRPLISRAREKAGWENLRDSMADPQIGLRIPIGVRELPKPEGKIRYELLYGEGRLTAAIDLGWKDITAIVKSTNNNETVGEFLAENLLRRKISWAEKGKIIRDEIEAGAELADVAKALHITPEVAGKYHRVLRAIAHDAQEKAFNLSVNDAEALTTVPSAGQLIVIELASESGEAVKEVAKAAKRAAEAGVDWTKASLKEALSTKMKEGKSLAERLKVLRLHHALGPGNVRVLMRSKAFVAAAQAAGLNLSKFEE